MSISMFNVRKWLTGAGVKGFELVPYPTVGKPYGFSLTHTVVGNSVTVYKSRLYSEIIQPLPGGDGKQAKEPTFALEALTTAAQELQIAAYNGPLAG